MAERFEFRLHIEGPTASRVVILPEGVTTIGRQADNTLQLDDLQVSRRHARIECSAAGCTLTDLGSTNGTRWRGQPLVPQVPVVLEEGAPADIGPFRLVLERVTLEPSEPLAAEEPAAPKSEAVPPVAPPSTVVPPPAPPSSKGPPPGEPVMAAPSPIPTGLGLYSQRLIDYLPDIYRTDFMSRFLALFESVLLPIEWYVDSWDLSLSPGTAPAAFLPWLANLYAITFDATWSDAQRRTVLAEAHQLLARRGTRWALSRLLEIYTGRAPVIDDRLGDDEPFTFVVRVPARAGDWDRESIERIIDAVKPAHTTYRLEFER